MTHPQEGLEAWTEQVHAYRIPRYDELPTLELYMDQVVAVIDDCLRIYLRDSKAQRLTPAMINNYVKLKVLPPPVKKRYNRTHLCYLIIICMLKQVLAIPEIRTLLADQLEKNDIRSVYNNFCDLQEHALALFSPRQEIENTSFSDRILLLAVHANVNKMIAEKMIDLQTPPDEKNDRKREKE